MTKPIEKWPDTYVPEVFAKKYGLTLKQAKTIISSNGPSKHGCDVGAAAFIRALVMRGTRSPARRRPTPGAAP
ncbi:MAG: hypothetical protein E5W38_18130 [Mesorhizobium sp.]|uniref:hypothetical protein n=1 Tax=Mesorhizobium sp. TaxID=1871066 RepID=UPI000FE55F67|nr:hypothetical protein [Mesorhizobium sp.]RWB50987.1 MAG: hypothetical protein EOQ47_31460 [Mesorhizobium sp.]TIU30797.1 MAG: hypothetical protein E5W38_18130 [Mesorhizobium sp.]